MKEQGTGFGFVWTGLSGRRIIKHLIPTQKFEVRPLGEIRLEERVAHMSGPHVTLLLRYLPCRIGRSEGWGMEEGDIGVSRNRNRNRNRGMTHTPTHRQARMHGRTDRFSIFFFSYLFFFQCTRPDPTWTPSIPGQSRKTDSEQEGKLITF